MVGSGSGGGGVDGGGGQAAGGGGAGSGEDGAAGMALGPLVDIPVTCWGWGVGHRVYCLGPYCLVCGGGGSGAGLDGDCGPEVPRPWVGLAGGGGGLWVMDDVALGDGDVDEGSDGVVFGGRLCGGGGRWWEGGAGCRGWGVLAWVRVWARAVSLGFVSLRSWCCGLRGVVLVVVLLLVVRSFGRRLGFRVGFWFGVRFELQEDSRPEVCGRRCRVGGFPGVLPGCLGRLCGRRGVPGSLACGPTFGFCRRLVDEVGGEGGV